MGAVNNISSLGYKVHVGEESISTMGLFVLCLF